MTIQTAFHNWQDAPMVPDPRRCSPLLITWRNHLLNTWGGQDLGCWGERSIVDGTSPSSHASGAAQDWRYQSPGPGRQVLLDTIIPWLIDNSLELGVQAIHDYVGCRIWRPPGTSGRPAQPSPESGWRQQTPGSQMGQSWALWIHLECLNTRWSDTRTIDQMLPQPSQPPSTGVVDMYVISVTRNGWPGPVDLVVDSANTRWNSNGNTSSLDRVAGVPRLDVDKNQALGLLLDRPGTGPCPFTLLPEYADPDLAW